MRKLGFFAVFAMFSMLFISIFIFNPSVLQGVENGMYLCVNVVIPSLYPALCLCACFAKTNFIYTISSHCDKISRALFHCSGTAIPIFLLSLISGYPSGSAMAQLAYKNECISIKERDKITLISCSAGPAFIVVAVGINMLGYYDLGIILLITHLFSNIITALFASSFFKKPSEQNSKRVKRNDAFSDIIVEGVANATASIISICAYTVIFGTVITVLSDLIGGTNIYLVLCSILEVSNGCLVLCINNASLPAIAATIGFGGFSVICQMLSLQTGKKTKFLHLLAVRILDAIISYLTCYIVLLFIPITETTIKTNITTLQITEQNIYFSGALILLAIVFITSAFTSNKRFVDFFR